MQLSYSYYILIPAIIMLVIKLATIKKKLITYAWELLRKLNPSKSFLKILIIGQKKLF